MRGRSLKGEDILEFARLENLEGEVWKKNLKRITIPPAPRPMTLEDLETALNNIVEQKIPVKVVDHWYSGLLQVGIYDSLGIEEIWKKAGTFPDCSLSDVPPDDSVAFIKALSGLGQMQQEVSRLTGEEPGETLTAVREMIDYLACYRQNRDLPEEERVYPRSMKMRFIQSYDRDSLRHAGRRDLIRYRNFVNELADQGDTRALDARYRSRYYGNASFLRNFSKARVDLEKLWEMTGDRRYARVLGNMYSQGKGRGGINNQKAIYYYGLGSEKDDWICTFELAQMYWYGRGIQDQEKAYNLIVSLYQEVRNFFEKGPFACPDYFVKVAFRLGTMSIFGERERNLNLAAECLLQARCVLNHYEEWYGHPYKYKRIARGVYSCVDYLKLRYHPQDYFPRELPDSFYPVRLLLGENEVISWKTRKLKSGDCSVTFKRVTTGVVFLIYWEGFRCQVFDSMRCRFTPASEDVPVSGEADRLVMEKEDGKEIAVFYREGEPVLKVLGDLYYEDQRRR